MTQSDLEIDRRPISRTVASERGAHNLLEQAECRDVCETAEAEVLELETVY